MLSAKYKLNCFISSGEEDLFLLKLSYHLLQSPRLSEIYHLNKLSSPNP